MLLSSYFLWQVLTPLHNQSMMKINYLFAKQDVTRIDTFQPLLTSINNETRQLQAAIPRSVSLKIKSGMVANCGKTTFTSQYLIKTSCVWPVTSDHTRNLVQLLVFYNVELLVMHKEQEEPGLLVGKATKNSKGFLLICDGPWTQA